MQQTTLTVEATFDSDGDAHAAASRLMELRHDGSNPIIGGAAHVDGATVTATFRMHPDSSDTDADTAAAEVGELLDGGRTRGARGGGVKVKTGRVEFVEEQYVDEAGVVQTRPANRVVHGETGETLRSTVREVKAVDPETDEVLGTVHIRSLVGEDGRKVVFPKGDPTAQAGPGGANDVTVTVDEVDVQHVPAP